MKIEIDVFQKEYYELQAKKIELKATSNLVLNAYTKEFACQMQQSQSEL